MLNKSRKLHFFKTITWRVIASSTTFCLAKLFGLSILSITASSRLFAENFLTWVLTISTILGSWTVPQDNRDVVINIPSTILINGLCMAYWFSTYKVKADFCYSVISTWTSMLSGPLLSVVMVLVTFSVLPSFPSPFLQHFPDFLIPNSELMNLKR